MKTILKPLKNKRGEGYIDVVVTVLIFTMLLVLAINVFSFLTLKQDMDYFAKEMIHTATVYGKTSDEVLERKEELSEETGLDPTISWDTTYFNQSTKTVQYGDTITIVLNYDTYLQGFGAVSVPMTLTCKYSGLSMKYWK